MPASKFELTYEDVPELEHAYKLAIYIAHLWTLHLLRNSNNETMHNVLKTLYEQLLWTSEEELKFDWTF